MTKRLSPPADSYSAEIDKPRIRRRFASAL